MIEIVGVRFKKSGKVYYFDPIGLKFQKNDHVIVETARGVEIGEVSINTSTLEVFKCGEKVAISTREFQLLEYLMKNAGKVLTREQIFSDVWGTEFGDIGTVAVNIKSIRDKIDPDNKYIKTVWGVGYKFVKVSR